MSSDKSGASFEEFSSLFMKTNVLNTLPLRLETRLGLP